MPVRPSLENPPANDPPALKNTLLESVYIPFKVLPNVIAGFVTSPTNDVDPNFIRGDDPDMDMLPVTTNAEPSKVKLASAFAVLLVPNEVIILLSAALVIVLNPVPLVPDEPELPEEPLEPDVPELPLEPE